RWRAALLSKLPRDIVVLESSQVADEFHATFSTTTKRYRYVIYNSITEHPFFNKYVWRIQQPLDVDLMQEAANNLIGTHDFRSFETNWPNKATSVRTVTDLTIKRSDDFIVLEIEADGFLYNMVRTITGTLINIGRETWPVSNVERILKTQDRKIAGATAPACGLYMAKVNYPKEVLVPPVD
ncbi:UNVERIFIED_CONTAM: hypothetical protein GTU68_036951, partial [Idotea baltica]|nr:hypothetical protein [Idotea baltica]